MKLTRAQERRLKQFLDENPEHVLYADVLRDGKGRNPTFRALQRWGLVEYTHVHGNSFRARLTERGIHYLHGEE